MLKFCQNLFAEYFDLAELSLKTEFEIVTAFEVFEHLADPLSEIEQILRLSDNVLFTTEIVPDDIESFKNWYYLSAETGQHISFYSLDSLKYLARKFGRRFYSNGTTTHVFTNRTLQSDPFVAPVIREPFFLRKARKYVRRHDQKGEIQMDSLIGQDWQFVKDKLNQR
ncbi:class I SAM-dependent methyltransferase [Dyadobacter sp. CY326]|uniref:class I SAM-dependent methyltransferase n=1 Tax=Dyadobacter sp. CY326 TaxID=2907300 RepID=UPI001F2CBEB2|nr:class I SAM-dependent methyltransferase [Dyadobacter sp. CY326]MCE7064007.1 class I SAM-dependent methyltransferase [Dyadobacter sp. CY326]